MDIKEEELLGDNISRHWYYIAKGKVVQKFLQHVQAGEVLDVGAGSGVFSRQLLAAGTCERAVCFDIHYDRKRAETYCGRPIEFAREMDDTPRDLILMMDVLEHVGDDAGMLGQFTKRLRPGGLILITVPAFQFLWSGHDVFLEHKRRYTLKRLEQLVGGAGLEVLHSRYFFALLFPLVGAMRLFDRLRLRSGTTEPKSALKDYPGAMNWLLIRLHDFERHLVLPLNRLFGLTIFCLARRTPEDEPERTASRR